MSGGEDDPLRTVKIEIHGILVAQQEPIGVVEIAHKYFDDFDYHLDPKKYRFNTLEDLLAAMPDTVVTVPSKVIHQKPKYKAVVKEETKDIQSLVGRQLTKEQALERKRNRSMPRQPPERKQTQYGAAFRYNGRESRGQMPQKVAQQKMVPVSDQKFASRFSSDYNEEDKASVSDVQSKDWVELNSSAVHNMRGQDTPQHAGDSAYQRNFAPYPEASGVSPPSRSESARSSGSLLSIGTVESESAFYANGAHEENDKSLAILQQTFRNPGDKALANDLPLSVKEIINFNPETFKVYEGQGGHLTVELMRQYSPEVLRRSGPFVRNAVEHDLLWVGKTCNVLGELQRIDSIAIIRMLSPSVFLATTRFGNEGGERFRAMSRLLFCLFREHKFRRVSFFKPGMGCIIHCDGEFARAILLSQADKAGFLHFACMDMNAVADVHYEDIFHILPEVETKAFPCNTFLARINGVGPVHANYAEDVANTFAEQAQGTTTVPVHPCIIHYIDIRTGWKGYVIDFVFQNEWISQWLLKNKMAQRNPKEELIYAYTPAVAERIIQEMEATNSFDMKHGDLREVADVSFINASVYPGFDAICAKICSPELPPMFNEPWIGDVVPPADTGVGPEESEQLSHDDTPSDEEMNADVARETYVGFAHGDVVPAVESKQCVAEKSPAQLHIPAVQHSVAAATQHSESNNNGNQRHNENTYLTLKVLLKKILDECGERRSEAAVHLASCGWNLINIAGDGSTTTNELYSVLNDLASEVTR